jgi:hypothetical protein
MRRAQHETTAMDFERLAHSLFELADNWCASALALRRTFAVHPGRRG